MKISSYLSAEANEILKNNPNVQKRVEADIARLSEEAMTEATAEYEKQLNIQKLAEEKEKPKVKPKIVEPHSEKSEASSSKNVPKETYPSIEDKPQMANVEKTRRLIPTIQIEETIAPPVVEAPIPKIEPKVDVPKEFHGKFSNFTPPIDVPKEFHGKFSNFTPQVDVPREFHGKSSPFTPPERITTIDTSIVQPSNNPLVNESPTSSASPSKRESVKKVHQEIHKQLSENSLKGFFDKGNLKSFDVESTGLDTKSKDFNKRDKIWQVGLAVDGKPGADLHVDPFFAFNKEGKSAPMRYSEKKATRLLRESAGQFSEKAFKEGNFNQFLSDYRNRKVETLGSALSKTFENVSPSDVIVLQNMNFENKIIKSSVDMGILDKSVYEEIASKMQTTSLTDSGETLHLFERPSEVQRKMRQADMIFSTQYLASGDDKVFNRYLNLVNSSMVSYEEAILNNSRTGAVAVELMDITKAFYANAADKGLLSKESATLGLSIDFLSQALYGEAEKHTAHADAELTNRLFKDLWAMTEELSSGKELSNTTLESIQKIKDAQPNEVNKKFVSTVRSVLEDFNKEGSTKLSNNLSWYSPEVSLKENGEYISLDKVAVAKKKRTNQLSEALENVLSRYSQYSEDINGFNRQNYVKDLLKDSTNSYKDLFERVDADYFKEIGISSETFKGDIVVPASNRPSRFNIGDDSWLERNKKKLGIGAAAALLYMWNQDRPNPVEKDYSNVSQNFYDEQYLGSAFVDFDERNKHFMM